MVTERADLGSEAPEFDEEEAVFLRARDAFHSYADNALMTEVTPRLAIARRVTGAYRELSRQNLAPHLEELKEAVETNQILCSTIAAYCEVDSTECIQSTALDDSKVQSTLRQLAREWSEDGERERMESYGRLLCALDKWYANVENRKDVKVLVPGSGLGRLPFEISLLGFNAVGNEFSTHMIMASQAILSSGVKKSMWTLYPYIHSHSHWRTKNDQLRTVKIPDISFDKPQKGEMSMAMGDLFDFALSDFHAGSFQAVVTSFFIDAPFDFFKTLDALTNITEEGGIWINFGPLLWHSDFLGGPDDELRGLELTLEDVLEAVERKGWKIIEHESGIPTTYCSTHPSRMGKMVFYCEFWLAQKIKQ